MFWLLNPKVWIAAALLAVLSATHFTAYRSGKAVVRAVWDKERAELTAKALAAEQTARATEQKLVSARQKAEVKYVEEKRKAAAAAAGAQSELGRLRDTLADAGRATCADPSAAARVASGARLESELLGNCATALVDLAAEADRLEALVVGLQQYVKNVCVGNQK